jgi:hypothetical protein
VGFIVCSPLVELDEIVLWDLQGDGDEVEQWVENLVVQVLGFVLAIWRDIAIGVKPWQKPRSPRDDSSTGWG